MSDSENRAGDPIDEREMAARLSLTGPAESAAKRWVLLRANRLFLTGVLSVGVFVALLVASVVWSFEMMALLRETQAIQSLLNSLLRGTIILVSIVVSINSIVLSQDLTSLATQQTRVDSTMEFRQRVEEVAEIDVCPTEPTELLQILLKTIIVCVEDFHELTLASCGEEFCEDATEYHRLIDGYTRVVLDEVSEDDSDAVEVLLAGMVYDYAGAIHATRQLNAEYHDEMNEEQREAMEKIIEALKLFSIGHEYFKTLFYMREFGRLSKVLLYVSLPVIVLISYVLLAVSAGEYPATTLLDGYLPLPFTTVFMMAAYTIALAPYLVLLSYILRSATVAVRSLAAGPLVLKE